MDEQNTAVSVKEAGTKLFDSVKTPVFWAAIGFVVCKWLDRKKA